MLEPTAGEPVVLASSGEAGILLANPQADSDRGTGSRMVSIATRILPPLGVFVLVLVAWQFGAPASGIHQYQLPVPTKIWQTFTADSSIVIPDGWFTFWNEAFRGYVIGSSVGFLIALLAWRFRPVAKGVMPYAIVSSAVPIVALAPALVPIAGSDWQSKVIICAIMTVFPMTVSAYKGLCSADVQGRELLGTYGASEWTVFRKLNLPSSLPFVFNALKINTTLALIGAIVAEYFGSPTNGLGLFISNNAGNTSYNDVWAGVLMACIMGIAFYSVVLLLERRLTGWHVSFRVR